MKKYPLVSIVTISYNQVQYLEECILSVIDQDYQNIEYIVVDPGSTDGSRDIIEKYRNKITHVIYEKDEGPADGLNIGFSHATGDVYYYLNSDDTLNSGAVAMAMEIFLKKNTIDIVYGHGYVVDENSKIIRKCYSDPFNIKRAAYGSSIVIQPSTFFKANCFKKVAGFNKKNKSNWDGELFLDMVLSKCKYTLVPEFFSNYRIYSESITGSGKFESLHKEHSKRMFRKIMNRDYTKTDKIYSFFYRVVKHLISPRAFLERLLRGPMFGER